MTGVTSTCTQLVQSTNYRIKLREYSKLKTHRGHDLNGYFEGFRFK